MGNFQKPPIMAVRPGLLKKTRNHGIRCKERRFPIDQILGKEKVLGVKRPLEEGKQKQSFWTLLSSPGSRHFKKNKRLKLSLDYGGKKN